MATLSLDSKPIQTGSFHFNVHGGVIAGAFTGAIALCFQQGDFSAIPSLLCLAAMAFVVLELHTPAGAAASKAKSRGGNRRLTYSRTHLSRRHSLHQ